jgi:pyridinium-3,5-bisthiocarboxylic acid mononucleotide nickel chelatase
MTKLAYLECPTGLAGDMCLGALVHAGVPLAYLSEQLERLGISQEFTLRAEKVQRNGQQATKVHVDLISKTPVPVVHLDEPGVDPYPTFGDHPNPINSLSEDKSTHHPAHEHHHVHHHEHEHPHAAESASTSEQERDRPSHHHTRYLPEIEQLIQAAHLPPRAEAWSLAVFRRLAEAEGAVHGIAPEQVHFHEVGATDAIVDIVGTCLGLDWLGIDRLYCSALPTGGGTVWAAHGRLPVPTPAVLKLWEMRQVPIYSNGIEKELVTPTGAAIATTLTAEFGAPPKMALQKIGLGAGSRNLPIPNILRLWIGESPDEPGTRQATHQPKDLSQKAASQTMPHSHPSPDITEPRTDSPTSETIAVLETQVDDLNPQAIGYLYDALFAVGALDLFTQAIGMKKSRPGILLTVICLPAQIEACEAVLFRETTTLGIRRTLQHRTALQRDFQTVQTQHGAVRIKIARQNATGAILNVQPEYEDCAKLAQQLKLPWREIHQAALCQWHQNQRHLQQHQEKGL